MRRPLARSIALLAAVALLVMGPGVAYAQTEDEVPDRDRERTVRERDGERDRDRDLDDLKKRILNQIERRLEALERMSEAVETNGHVTPVHAAHLQNDFRTATRLLEDGAEAVADAETLAELREVVPKVFQETLVFALLRPKTHLVVASDTLVDVAEQFEAFAARLQKIIDRLAANGHDVGVARAALEEMVALIADAAALAEPVAGNVIGLDPDDWPEPAKSALEEGRADLRQARDLLHQARGEAREVIQIIRELVGR